MTLPNAAPKPEPAPPKKRSWSSIKPKSPAEIRAILRAKSQRSSIVSRPKKPIQKKNAKRVARKSESYRKGLASYRKSPAFKEVELRAQGQCERMTRLLNEDGVKVPMRCTNRRDDGFKLEHHHLRYSLRFGGKELASDIIVLCKDHHRLVEAKKRPWNRNGRRGA